MKEYVREAIQRLPDPQTARSWVREYLQARILESLQAAGAMAVVAFHGGTCLRFLYSTPRYSEDLDFALERPSAAYDLPAWVRRAQRDLAAEAYTVEAQVRDDRPVHSALIRFPGLLLELGLSAQRAEVTAVKLEIDTRPPAGARCETTLVRRHVLLNLFHHDRASLLAGKLNAVLTRPYAKGRDLYDLLWYLSDRSWPEPNLQMLSSALRQSGWTGPVPAPGTWKGILAARLAELDWREAANDVRPFVEKPAEVALLTQETFARLLS